MHGLTWKWLLLLAVFCSAAAAADGVMTASGEVWMNSVLLPGGAQVAAGDRIATGDSGHAVIHSRQQGRVEILRGSYATLEHRRVLLHWGAVRSARTPVRVGAYAIEPEGGAQQSSFSVAKRQGRLLVASHNGGVRISGQGMTPLLVPAGGYAERDTASASEKTASPADNAPEAAPAADAGAPVAAPADGTSESARNEGDGEGEEGEDEGSGIAKTAGTATAAGIGGWSIGTLSHAASVAIVAGGATAVAGTTAAVALRDSESVSPSQ